MWFAVMLLVMASCAGVPEPLPDPQDAGPDVEDAGAPDVTTDHQRGGYWGW